MPRGVPLNGYRMTENRLAAMESNNNSLTTISAEHAVILTDEQISTKIAERFDILNILTKEVISGGLRSLMVSGPAGLGKSYLVETVLKEWDTENNNHTIVKGYVRTVALFRLLYQHRKAGQVLVFDDADTIFFEDTSLNILKAVCDTTEERVVSYHSEYQIVDDATAEVLPKTFQFNGAIIFITNYDMDSMIAKGHRLAPHFSSMISRSHYVDLMIKTKRDYMVRIRQVVNSGMLRNMGLKDPEVEDVMRFVEKNKDRLRELSLRMPIKIANLRKGNPDNWERIAQVTCTR